MGFIVCYIGEVAPSSHIPAAAVSVSLPCTPAKKLHPRERCALCEAPPAKSLPPAVIANAPPVCAPCAAVSLVPPAAVRTTVVESKVLFARIITEHKKTLGNVDASTIAHYLPRYYKDGSIWDIGANKGDTSQVLISALVPGFFCLKFYSLTETSGANCPRWGFPFFAAEMNPQTASVLNKRATFERWDMLSYIVISGGFSDVSGATKITLSDESSGSEVASLAFATSSSSSSSNSSSSGSVDIPLYSVDDYRETRGDRDAPIFLLKIDTEGFDGKVLKGAQKALAAHRVKFVIAEYNSMWASVVTSPGGAPEWSLQKTTQYLFKLGYECHLMNLQHFIPLWGAWWQDDYEFWGHSNFMCAVMCDEDMRHLIAVTQNSSLQVLERDDCVSGGGGGGGGGGLI